MRIAFVGKGGSGKSTMSAAFAMYLESKIRQNILVFDADLNIHIPNLLGFDEISLEKHLSNPSVSDEIKKWLIGENNISNVGAFRKSTPPTNRSNILKIESIENSLLSKYSISRNNLFIFVVGTYQEKEIGTACYHTSLSVFENILTHCDDQKGFIVADMVAGIDSFAGTLHMQFDLVCLLVEPTLRSIDVYKNYLKLAQEAGEENSLIVLANKIKNEDDKKFISNNIENNKLIGFFTDEEHFHYLDKSKEKIKLSKIKDHNINNFEKIYKKLISLPDHRNQRLLKIRDIHRKYIKKPFITERFGDLSGQIDPDFKF